MQINSLKDLKSLIKMLQEQGVKSIRLPDLELELLEKPQVQPRRKMHQIDLNNLPHVPGSEAEYIQVPEANIATDELTPEDLLFYSAGSQETIE